MADDLDDYANAFAKLIVLVRLKTLSSRLTHKTGLLHYMHRRLQFV